MSVAYLCETVIFYFGDLKARGATFSLEMHRSMLLQNSSQRDSTVEIRIPQGKQDELRRRSYPLEMIMRAVQKTESLNSGSI